ncbi:MAG: endonuclease III [Thermoplasmata archaeon]|jgi:endonuclease-3|nr:endonuclease III [Thermoplasmata archaeon]
MSKSENQVLRRKAEALNKKLTSLYGRQEIESAEDPLDTLIETILSQNTTDKNSGRAFAALKKAYPTWDALLGEPADRVAAVIRSGGLAGIKAQRILDALSFIKVERGELDLEFLRAMRPPEAEAWLARMKGVGPKTRSIVLLFSLDMPAFPVDTHIHRVSKRLGLIGPRTTREQAQEELALLVPPREFFNFHINIIEHGRAVCRARNPMCAKCTISSMCDYYRSLRKAQS